MIAFMPVSAGATNNPTSTGFDRPHPVLASLTVAQTDAAYIVKPGDSLSKIAKHAYGNPNKWPIIWYHNRHLIHNPNKINPNEHLRIPVSRHMTARMMAMAQAALPPPPPPPAPPVVATSAPAPQAAPASQAPATPVAQTATYTGGSGFQACVITRESGGNPGAVNPTSGAGGLYGFLPSTWQRLGHSGLPENASVAEQNQAFQQEYAQSGTSAWSPYDGC